MITNKNIFPSKRWLLVPILLCPIILLLSMVGLYEDIGRPFPGFIIHRSISTARYYPSRVNPPWYFPSGINSQSILKKINGQSFEEHYISAIEHALDSTLSVEMSICEATEPINLACPQTRLIQIPITIFDWGYFFDFKIPLFLSGLGFFLIAIVTYRIAHVKTYHILATIAFSLTVQIYWGSDGALYVDERWIGKLLDFWIWIILSPFLGAIILHFVLLYPIPSRLAKRSIVVSIYLVSLVISVLYGMTRIIWWLGYQEHWFLSIDKFCYLAVHWYAILAIIVMGIRCIAIVLNKKNKLKHQNQSKNVLKAIPLFMVYMVWEAIRVSGPPGFNNLTAFIGYIDIRYFALALLFGLVYNFLRYEYYDRFSILLQIIMVLILALFVADIQKSFTYHLQQNPNIFSEQMLIFAPSFLAIMLTAIAISVFYASFHTFLGQRSFSVIQQFSQRIANQPHPAQLSQAIVQACLDELSVDFAAIWLKTKKQENIFVLETFRGEIELTLPKELYYEFIQNATRTLQRPVYVEEWWPSDEIELLVPLVVGNAHLGAVGLGRRSDGQIFSPHDIEVIDKMAQEAASLLLNAITVREIPTLISQAQERERFQIAQELHDTIQQHLGRVPILLEISRKKLLSAPQDSDAQIQKVIADTEQAAQTLRSIRNQIAPTYLEKSLIEPVLELVRQFEAQSKVKVTLTISDDLTSVSSLEVRHIIYRILQQALDNISQHAQAANANIQIEHTGSMVTLRIQDDGKGFSQEERKNSIEHGSFGLLSMEGRAQMMGGRLEIHSEPGHGTSIEGYIPLTN